MSEKQPDRSSSQRRRAAAAGPSRAQRSERRRTEKTRPVAPKPAPKPAPKKAEAEPKRPVKRGTAVHRRSDSTGEKVQAAKVSKNPRRQSTPRAAASSSRKTQTQPPTRQKSSGQLEVAEQEIDDQDLEFTADKRGGKGKKVTLRSKFLVVMVGITAVGMIALGGAMAMTSNSFLFGSNLHKGIEIAKMAAQVSSVLLEQRTERGEKLSKEELVEQLTHYLGNARKWGDQDIYSDIISIQFKDGEPRIRAETPIGDGMSGLSDKISLGNSIYIPREGDVTLPADIAISEVDKVVKGRGKIPVYRFEIKMNDEIGKGGDEDHYSGGVIWVDVAGDTVDQVTSKLFLMIGIAVLAVIGIASFVAHIFAGKITKPVRLLVRDIKIVAKGDLKHKTKSHSNDEIGLLATEFNRMTAEVSAAQDAMIEQEKASYELSIAQEVQQQLLPAESPKIDGYALASYYKGAKAVSGDYYDFIPLGNDLWGFIIADVSGKGIPGSMVMAVARTIIRLVAGRHQGNAAETLKETNRLIAKQIKRGMFVTAFYAVLDARTGVLTYSSAGHNPMVIYRGGTDSFELAAPKGIAIGFNDGPIFDKNIQQFQSVVEPGDAIVLYTDGYPEAMNEKDEEYGDDEFNEAIARYGKHGAQGIVDGSLREIIKHRGKAPQSDDLTMIVVQRVGQGV